jgi:epoxyqueuosine reductase
MDKAKIYDFFKEQFDLVGIIKTKTYNSHAKKMNFPIAIKDYPTMVVLGYAYPKRLMKHSHTHLIPSFYTFGRDYHTVLKNKIESICLKLDIEYEYGVDNHPLNERLMAELSGIGFFAKNQLIINKDFGSYIFLAYVQLDIEIKEEIKSVILEDCGDCRKCIEACPTNALIENGYIREKCISHFNQEKQELSQDQVKANYQLFGCDICQLVCPKNRGKGLLVHKEFELSGKERVSISDLFNMSQKEFKNGYKDMAYLWKGKTLLMRNAVTLLYNHKNTNFNNEIKRSIDAFKMPWYKNTVSNLHKELEKMKS